MLIKVVSPAGWNFDTQLTVPLKYSSRGLIGADRAAFVKRAGHVFLPYIDSIKFAADEEPVHAIAVGATEAWGANRNGDGFTEATCRKCAHTFETHARGFRNHVNMDPAKSYGVIKKAVYNEAMRRIELLVAYSKTKLAAERNGGLIADKELEKLARGEDLPGSMACKIAADVCSFCHNRSRTRDEYCTASTCKAGGCKEHLGKIVKIANDVHHLHVDNPDPLTWFDWSTVFRPADRTAYGARADWLHKTAADLAAHAPVVGGAQLAEEIGLLVPAWLATESGLLVPASDMLVKLAVGLADLESCQPLPSSRLWARAFAPEVAGVIATETLGEPQKEACAEGLLALADQGCILRLDEFATLYKRGDDATAAKQALPGAYARMRDDGSLTRRVQRKFLADGRKTASAAQRTWAAGYQARRSLEPCWAERRAVSAEIQGIPLPSVKTGFDGTTKQAAASAAAEELARDYACYQAQALQRMAERLNSGAFLLTARLALLQNAI